MSLVYIHDNPTVYTSQQLWEIDPTNGSDAASGAPGHPLKTWAEYRRRVGTAAAPTGLQIKLLNPLPSSDPLRPPYIGPDSTVLIYADMTVQTTGTFTSVTAAAPTTGSGTRTKITDSALSSSGFGPYIDMLIAIVGGARAGATAFLLKNTGSKSAEVQYFQGPLPQPTFGFNLIDPQVGDAYEVRSWPVSVGLIEFDQPISSDQCLVFQGLQLTSPSFPLNIPPTAICCVNCDVTAPTGKMTFTASLVDSCVAKPGDEIYFLGCGITSLLYVEEGARVLVDGESSAQAAPITVFGKLLTCEMSCFDASGDAVAVQPGGMHQTLGLGNGYTENLYGSGASGVGVRTRNMSGSSYVTKPRITGSGGNSSVGGTAKAWTAIPFINTTNNAAITAYA